MTDHEPNRPDENPEDIPGQPDTPGQPESSEQPDAPKQPAAPEEFGRYVAFRRVLIGVKEGYVLRKVGQAYMVMPTGPRMKEYQGMITLNETGAFLFKKAQNPEVSKESLIEDCKAEYGATDEGAKEAVGSFIQQCAECGLFEYETVVIDRETGKLLSEEGVEVGDLKDISDKKDDAGAEDAKQ